MPVCQLLQTSKQGSPLLSSHRDPDESHAWGVHEKAGLPALGSALGVLGGSHGPFTVLQHPGQGTRQTPGMTLAMTLDLVQPLTSQMRKLRLMGRGMQRMHRCPWEKEISKVRPLWPLPPAPASLWAMVQSAYS